MHVMLQNIRKFIFERICLMLIIKHKIFILQKKNVALMVASTTIQALSSAYSYEKVI